MSQHGGTRPKIAVLNATTDFQELRMDPFAAQLSELRRMSTLDIAQLFGVPPYLLGLPGDSATYANVESRAIEFREYTLLPWIRLIESCLDAQFPRGTSLKIKTAGLERADTATRYNAYKTALDAGFLTINDVRRLEDLPELGEADLQGPGPATTEGPGPAGIPTSSEEVPSPAQPIPTPGV
jgi:HK97 family phage portal protein